MQCPAPRPTIVVTVDGLRAAALGAYGQTAYETPTLDALAAESRVFDWAYSPSPDLGVVLTRVGEVLCATGLPVFAASDDPDFAALAGGAAGSVKRIDAPSVSESAESVEATHTAALWEAFTSETLEALGRETAPLVWLHTRGLHAPWDAPAELIEELVDAEDPPIEASVTAPDLESLDGDARFAASCRYAAQAMTLDACLAGWLGVVRSALEGVDYRVVLAGVRGFPLGEHGRIGGVDPRLFSEQQQVPVLVYDGDGATRFDRHGAPTSLEGALRAALLGAPLVETPVLLASSDARAAVTRDWLLRVGAGAGPELYVKPDDRWEQNDVATLRETVVEELAALLAP